MEKALEDRTKALEGLVAAALTEGTSEEPTKALDRIREDWKVAIGGDDLEKLYRLIADEYGCVRKAQEPGASEDCKERAVSIIRWIINTALTWKHGEAANKLLLFGVLVMISFLDPSDIVWRALGKDSGNREALVDALEDLLKAISVSISDTSYSRRMKDDIDRIARAENDGDLAVLMDYWQMLSDYREDIPLFDEPIKALNILARDRLCSFLDGTTSIVAVAGASKCLARNDRLILANECGCRLVQTGFLRSSLVGNALTEADHRAIVELLVNVAGDHDAWSTWMRIFNTFPRRFPKLQEPLGEALASASKGAVEEYVNSIELRWRSPGSPGSRSMVGCCLKKFSETATQAQRVFLWQAAYSRWLNWKFGLGNEDGHLIQVSWSDLDFAVVGYAKECMTRTDRDQRISGIIGSLTRFPSDWFPSVSKCNSGWHALLSELQPFAHVNHPEFEGRDWLWTSVYELVEPGPDSISKLRFAARMAF